jgi:hypothetical protein|tara:strand:+ start:31 stop:228 length:198 start_codon:yes stop_codon:yes gene_type:complete
MAKNYKILREQLYEAMTPEHRAEHELRVEEMTQNVYLRRQLRIAWWALGVETVIAIVFATLWVFA